MSSHPQTHLYIIQINSIRFNFIGIVELIMCLKFLKTDLKLDFEIKNLNFINLRFENLQFAI